MALLNRRTILRGAALTAGFACISPTLAQEAPRRGCAFCDLGRRTGGMTFDDLVVTRTTGDAETDRFLAIAISRLSETFDVKPRFGFFDDSRGENAFALRNDNAVVMGKRLFSRHMAANPDGMVIVGILAHEFGHISQYNSGYGRRLEDMASSVMPAELHADFFAGYYLAQRKADHPQLDLQVVGRAFDKLGDTDFESPQHHGTNAQRIASVTAGFDYGRAGARAAADIAEAGFNYVSRVV